METIKNALKSVGQKFYRPKAENAESEAKTQEEITEENRRKEQKKLLDDIAGHNAQLDNRAQMKSYGIDQTNGQIKSRDVPSDEAIKHATAYGYMGGKRRKSRLRKSKKRANKKSRKTRRR